MPTPRENKTVAFRGADGKVVDAKVLKVHSANVIDLEAGGETRTSVEQHTTEREKWFFKPKAKKGGAKKKTAAKKKAA